MVILLVGATGFLGRRLARALLAAGHEVVQVQRRLSGPSSAGETEHARLRRLQGDFTTDHRIGDWLPRLQGVDAVINAAGILRESGQQTFEALHVRGPRALFEAAVQAGVRRVLQVSALGANADARSAYHRSKRAADEHLLGLPLAATVVQPALLYGTGGASARLFSRLAVLPWVPVPGSGRQEVQPLHVDDAVQALLALLDDGAPLGRVEFAGPQAMGLSDFLLTLRRALGLPPTRVVPIPQAWVSAAAWLGSHWPGALLDRDTWGMLQRGNTGDAAPVRALLGHPPRPPAAFVERDQAPALRQAAQLEALLPVLRWSLALVWLVTAVVSIAVFPREQSLDLLQRAGVPAAWSPLLLWGAAAFDAVLGVATLFWHRWRPLWGVQAALIAFYTAVITLRLPEFWAHPYGPVLKNLPLLALLWLLHALAPPRPPAEGPR
ncbi:MAG TPA: SDR family oxidoreductase [Hydrogenophaga sp.]|uniref:SDR family oxidoreductase n=1 Tax=Hydrogenophaga sp. TaxID=1904254 RepID=UPI002C12D569|nr:SDR family oxidoreductase [Hydrogenophaga sp.]HSX91645.1 SDR family oxidoreductase [Hydrogenophaga sp.]